MASIQKRGESSWLLVVEAGYDSSGKRIKRTKTVKGMGKRDAEKELAKFQTEVLACEYIAPEKMKFEVFVEEWREKYAEKELAPLTLKTYNHHLKNHILPAIGHLRLDQIRTIQLINLLDSLSKAGVRKDGREDTLASGTIQYIYRVIKNIFNRATDWKLIKSNPLTGIKKPKVIQSEMSYYDESEAQEVIKALYSEPVMWRLFCLIAILGGLRRGEILALEWTDIDYELGCICVNKSISLTINSKAIVKEPKSKGSRRSVPMPVFFMEELKSYHHTWKVKRMQVGDMWLGNDHLYIFHAGFGKPIYHTQPSKWWK